MKNILNESLLVCSTVANSPQLSSRNCFGKKARLDTACGNVIFPPDEDTASARWARNARRMEERKAQTRFGENTVRYTFILTWRMESTIRFVGKKNA